MSNPGATAELTGPTGAAGRAGVSATPIWAALTGSLAVHGAVLVLLGLVEFTPPELLSLDTVSMDVVEEPAPEPEPAAVAPEPEPEAPAPVPPPRVVPPPPPKEPPPPPPAEPPPPAAETPVDFGNLTLTNEGKSSFAVAPSSGVEQEGPIGPPGVNTGQRRDGVVGGTPGGTGDMDAPIVPLANLSKPPGMPTGMDDLMERYYPRAARAQGIAGTAKARVRIDADGKLRVLSVTDTSDQGFGDACRSALERSPKWDPPVDKAGRRVATSIQFTCNFEVRD